MEDHKRSHRAGGTSFPQTPPKGGSGGNECFQIPLGGQATITLELPSSWRRFRRIFYGTLKTASGSVPFIGVVSLAKDGSGKVESHVELLTIPKIKATAGKAGSGIMRRHFKNFFKAAEGSPGDFEAWSKALALDCAAEAKDPVFMGAVKLESLEDWKAFKKAERSIRKTDDLDYLLANRYMAEGWNKMRLEDVGRIVAKRLKLKKPVPATTLNRRLGDLELRCLPEGRPQTIS